MLIRKEDPPPKALKHGQIHEDLTTGQKVLLFNVSGKLIPFAIYFKGNGYIDTNWWQTWDIKLNDPIPDFLKCVGKIAYD